MKCLILRVIITLMDKVVLTASVIALFLIAMMMFFTSPGVVGPLGIMIFFVLIYVFFLGLAVFGCRLFFRMLGKANKIYANHIVKKSYRYGHEGYRLYKNA